MGRDHPSRRHGGLSCRRGLPWFACCALHEASRLALTTLVVSHLVVQLVKRTVGRGRPAVHYPSDVLVGQMIAIATVAGVWTAS